ncbi:MAG: phosphohydrolase, partial [Treponema sp.]|nr:phosphohydrolase [Treponema sp.]
MANGNHDDQASPAFFRKLLPSGIRRVPALAWSLSFLLCLAVVVLSPHRSPAGSADDFEAGRVADRDVFAERSLTFVDEAATALRIEAQERLVPAVFHFSDRASEEQRDRWGQFSALAAGLWAQGYSPETFALSVQAEFPGYFSGDALTLLFNSDERQLLLDGGAAVLDAMLAWGIFAIPQTGLERLNPDVLELIRLAPGRIEQERLLFENVVVRSIAAEAISGHIVAGAHSPLFVMLAPRLLDPFLRENVFFSQEDTARRVAEARAAAEPVMRSIEQGQHIIKRGFIVTEEEMAELAALRIAMPQADARGIFADALFLLLLFSLLCYLSGSRIIGRSLRDSEVYLVSGLSALYIAGSVLVRGIPIEAFPVSVVVPTALVMMLPS